MTETQVKESPYPTEPVSYETVRIVLQAGGWYAYLDNNDPSGLPEQDVATLNAFAGRYANEDGGRNHVARIGDTWRVWIPPVDASCYKDGDVEGLVLPPWGGTWFDSEEAANEFLRSVAP